MDFFLGIHHVARIRRIRCHIGPPPMDFLPPPPRIKYHMVKVPIYGISPPPPSQQKSHMLSQYYILSLCWRRFAIEGEGLPYGIIPSWGSSAIGFLPGGGGRFATWYYSPWGSSAMGFLPRKACHKVFLQGKVCHMVWYYSPLGKFCHRISSGGGGGGRRFATWYYPPPPGKFCYEISSGGKVCHKVFLHGENVCHMV